MEVGTVPQDALSGLVHIPGKGFLGGTFWPLTMTRAVSRFGEARPSHLGYHFILMQTWPDQ